MKYRKFFTGDEKMSLIDLVDKYRDIIESKRTDCVSMTRKRKVWIKLTSEYNSIGENSARTTNQLRKCWDNIKSRRKKELDERDNKVTIPRVSYVGVNEVFCDVKMIPTVDVDPIDINYGDVGESRYDEPIEDSNTSKPAELLRDDVVRLTEKRMLDLQIEEQRLKNDAQRIRNRILNEQLKQELVKTEMLKNELKSKC